MRKQNKVLVGVALALSLTSSFAGSASVPFSVKVVLVTANNASGGSCTGTTSITSGASSLQVQCSPGIVATVSSVASVASVAATAVPTPGRFLPGYRPARDSLLPDFCRSEITRGDQTARITCRLDDQRQLNAGNEADEGWEIESRLYAVNTEDEAIQAARLRLQEDKGILTGIRLASADGRSGPVEMLVSF